jgi:integrase/recombinase XerD
MKIISLLVQLRPRTFTWWRSLPLFGPVLDDFVRWLGDQGYTAGTIGRYLETLSSIVRWLGRRRIKTLDQLTQQRLQMAQDHYRPKQEGARGVVRMLKRFLTERRLVPEGDGPPPCPVEVEIERFATYLRETRGLAEATVTNHGTTLRAFLRHLRFNGKPTVLQRLQPRQIQAFLLVSARTNNRFSLQHVVATLRAYLQERHAQGVLPQPLHLQIDTPRVYRGERLPRALPWTQVQAFLQSIDRSDPFGRRDFTLLYLAAAYGLRNGELVRLTLDDIDWRASVLRVRQTKTRQTLRLPLTDEAAQVLIDYLRHARPKSTLRQLFLRVHAPLIPLQPDSVHDVLENRLRRSGLNLPIAGTQVLRHSFATRLMQQGVSIKAIGDTLGHRDIESTSVYLRLDMDELRQVALAVPATPPGPLAKLVGVNALPQIRPARACHHLPTRFQSRLAPSLQAHVDLKRALGRHYVAEAAVLRHWDNFIRRRYPRARQVRAEMFSGWTKTLVTLTSTVSRSAHRIVRNFLLFHARSHPSTFIPDRLTFPKNAPSVTPRLVSAVEMGRALAAVGQLPPSFGNPLRAETFHLGLLLLFCCGLRRRELLRLTLADLQAEQTVLHIRCSKFYKSRLVPLSPSVTLALRQYLQQRSRKKLPMASDAPLMWSPRLASKVYGAQSLATVWHQVCVSTKVLNEQGHPPRLHDLRHSCAVLVLQQWYAQGADVQAKLPHLAAYLGHVSAVSTHHYLKLTPELRQAASRRFHEHFAPLFAKGGLA